MKKPVFRKDYKAPEFLVPETHLSFLLSDDRTMVTAKLSVRRNGNHQEPLRLYGNGLELISLSADGKPLQKDRYEYADGVLTVRSMPDVFELETAVYINPEANLALEGLYKSGDILCTQNEPEGFRSITFFPDRPDVMSSFTVEITGDKKKYPVMLSNGNCILSEDLPGGMHRAVWKDPFPKPSYLFALVAGKLGMISGIYTTGSGRKVDCRIYCDPGNENFCRHALASLMKAMAWDEKRFGLEYDLDIYMIVAVDSFNMGAMENKGLNIFNSKYVLATEGSATDDDFLAVESVVGHEYFHNWTGDRVTLRDWFQLTLKEGLTVFRDQEFTSDIQSRPVKRISDVIDLRALQFPEDSGPNAHPIRPDSYTEMNNFYTSTVYEKGAEVHRMIHTLLGEETFQKGMKRYISLNDGKAVTCDDFTSAMEYASGLDLSRFMLWYSQAGTPEIFVREEYDSSAKKLKLHLRQEIPDTPGQKDKLPMVIPLRTGILDGKGREISSETVLKMTEREQDFIFTGIPQEHYVSVNRNFSAPVKLHYERSMDELIFLFSHDTDPVNRWDAGQSAAIILEKQLADGTCRSEYTDAFSMAVKDLLLSDTDSSFRALALLLPSEEILAQEYDTPDFEKIHTARSALKRIIGLNLEELFAGIHEELLRADSSSLDIESAGRRKLRLRLLDYLAATEKEKYLKLASDLYFREKAMTGKLGALTVLASGSSEIKQAPLKDFYEKWHASKNVIMKWFALQASAPLEGTLDRVLELEKYPAWDIRTPNLVRSLTGAFGANQFCFHRKDGAGYRYLADRIIQIDAFNPQISAGLAKAFKLFGRLDPARKALMEAELVRILRTRGKDISANTREITEKTLGQA